MGRAQRLNVSTGPSVNVLAKRSAGVKTSGGWCLTEQRKAHV